MPQIVNLLIVEHLEYFGECMLGGGELGPDSVTPTVWWVNLGVLTSTGFDTTVVMKKVYDDTPM